MPPFTYSHGGRVFAEREAMLKEWENAGVLREDWRVEEGERIRDADLPNVSAALSFHSFSTAAGDRSKYDTRY